MSPFPEPEPPGNPAPGLARRLGAAVYDALLLLAVLFFATLVVLPLNGGRAFESANFLYSSYLVAVSYAYFAWFWTHGGQTLGMRAWRLRLRTDSGERITWTRSLARFSAATLSWLAAGAGFLWSLYDAERRTWHDRLSHTSLIIEPRA